MRKANLAAAFAAIMATLLSGCGGGASATGANTTPTAIPVPPLAAPTIVQVENSPEGRPQSGLANADIVYEYVAEGGIGRFSLVFFHAPDSSQKVGPVRSARTVTLRLMQQYHAMLMFSGASTFILSKLQSVGFPNFDEDHANGNLFRISQRYAPHNLYTDGSHMAALSQSAKLGSVDYQLWSRGTATTGGTPVNSFTVPISDFERPVFTWSAALSGFTRAESTGPVVDPTSGKPLVIPTVIVQQVGITADPNVIDVNGVNGVDHAITGTGAAQVFTGGNEYQAKWTQSGDGTPQFTLADGSPAPIAAGEVWICLVATGSPVSVVAGPVASPTPAP